MIKIHNAHEKKKRKKQISRKRHMKRSVKNKKKLIGGSDTTAGPRQSSTPVSLGTTRPVNHVHDDPRQLRQGGPGFSHGHQSQPTPNENNSSSDRSGNGTSTNETTVEEQDGMLIFKMKMGETCPNNFTTYKNFCYIRNAKNAITGCANNTRIGLNDSLSSENQTKITNNIEELTKKQEELSKMETELSNMKTERSKMNTERNVSQGEATLVFNIAETKRNMKTIMEDAIRNIGPVALSYMTAGGLTDAICKLLFPKSNAN
jgi:hypothetical protein